MLGQQQNPWRQLPGKRPYALPDDIQAIKVFNSSARDEFRIHLEVLPEPYLGNPSAPVVVLGLNPGFTKDDLRQHRNRLFAKRSRGNLLHAPADYPFYLLDPGIDRTFWWDRILRRWLEDPGLGRQKVAHRVLCVEYFPYHSRRFKHQGLCVPSQQYSFWLVRQALEREAAILMMRGEECWLKAVPELARHPRRYYKARSWQNPAITPRNFPGGFDAAVEALQRVTWGDAPEGSA